MRRRTFSDRGSQLALPLAGAATQVARVAVSSRVLIVEPSAHHVEHALRRSRSFAFATTLPLFEAKLARAVLPGVRVADNALARVSLRRVLESLPSLSNAAERAGLAPGDFVDALDSALGALHAADVDVTALRIAARGAAPGLSARLQLLADAMSAHEQALAALGLCDRRTVAARVARALDSSADPSDALDGAVIVELRDFAALPPARLALLEALHRRLLRHGGRVVLVSPTARASLLTACGIEDPLERIAATLEARFAAHDPSPELQHVSPGEGTGVLSGVASRLFTGAERDPLDVPGALEIITAAGASVQAEVAAAAAARALRDGIAAERIVIALPAADEGTMRPLRRALHALSVPFYEGRGAPPTDSLPIATLLRALHAMDDAPRKEHLVELLRGVRGLGARSLRIRTADALARVPGSDLRRDGPALLAALSGEEHALAAKLIELLCVAPRPRIGEALAHLRAIGEALGWPDALTRHASDVVRSGDVELLAGLASDLSSWASLAAATDELARAVDLAGAHELVLDWRELARELESALSARHLVPGHRAGAVAIERIRDRLGLECELLIVVDAHDGSLPARTAPDALLSRAVVERLRACDPRRAPPPRALTGALDLLAAIDAVGRSARTVVIQRGVDDDGRTLLPGALPIELARVTTARPRTERLHAIPLHTAPRTPREAYLRALVAGPATVPAHVAARVEAERVRARAFAGAEEGRTIESPFAGAIGTPERQAAELLGQRLGASPEAALSVSAAEQLLACPFLVFAERILRASPKESSNDEGSARVLGELAHRALLAAYRALRAEPAGDAASVASAAILGVFAETATTTSLERVRRERLHDDLVATILLDLAQCETEARTFFEGEVPFGTAGAWPALELSDGQTRVHLRGQIDRIDRAPHGATVIDYKSRAPTGASGAKFFDEVRPGSAQIAVYARVVRENLVPPPERVLARFIGYRGRNVPEKPVGFPKKNDGSVWTDNVGDAAGGQGLGAVGDAIVASVRAIRDGAVPPQRNPRCEQCAQRVACRVPPVVLEEAVE